MKDWPMNNSHSGLRPLKHRIGAALLAASAVLALSACATDDGYGYGGVSVGYGSGYYGDPYWGWYDNYYYPGTGYYIYDRGGARHSWNDSQRRYWESRRGGRPGRENWSGYRGAQNPGSQNSGDSNWQQRREAWRARNQGQNQGLTDEQRQQRREAWQARRQQQGQSQGNPPSPTGDPADRGNRGGRGEGHRHRGN